MTTPPKTLSSAAIKRELRHYARPERAREQSRFFKTGAGDYGEGMRFLGVTVPEQRKIAGRYRDIDRKEVGKLLDSSIHEHRLTALLILVFQYQSTRRAAEQAAIYRFYMKHINRVNNWDLVDASSYKIVGAYLYEHKIDRAPLYALARSRKLWRNRVAIVSTLYFISKNDLATTMEIAEILLPHKHDLIHKAVGWMLREVGKRDEQLMLDFIRRHYDEMPRTMLRYAIEKIPETRRKKILDGQV